MANVDWNVDWNVEESAVSRYSATNSLAIKYLFAVDLEFSTVEHSFPPKCLNILDFSTNVLLKFLEVKSYSARVKSDTLRETHGRDLT